MEKMFKGFQRLVGPEVTHVKRKPFHYARGTVALGSPVALIQREYGYNRDFVSWMATVNNEYPNHRVKVHRYQIFKANLRKVQQHNSCGKYSYTPELDFTADLTTEEFFSGGGLGDLMIEVEGHETDDKLLLTADGDDEVVPEAKDWRASSHEGSTESRVCWIFVAVASIEAVNKIVTGELVVLSEQQVRDCQSKCYDPKRGGNLVTAYNYVLKEGGLSMARAYHFTGYLGKCKKIEGNMFGSINGYGRVAPNDEKALMRAVARQPIAAGVCGDRIQFVSKGVHDMLDTPVGSEYKLNHAILLVGYETDEDGQDFWLCRNSWSTGAHEGGYFKLKRNHPDKRGHCGVAQYVVYSYKFFLILNPVA